MTACDRLLSAPVQGGACEVGDTAPGPGRQMAGERAVGSASRPRVRQVNAAYDGAWELPVLGEVEAPPAVLIRPDGHVAWVGELADPALPGALTRWFGDRTS